MAALEYLYLGIFIVTLIIIATKDIKTKTISKPVILFGAVVGGAYIVYLYIIKKVDLFKQNYLLILPLQILTKVFISSIPITKIIVIFICFLLNLW